MMHAVRLTMPSKKTRPAVERRLAAKNAAGSCARNTAAVATYLPRQEKQE
jgi:hypothetical protein